MKLPGAVQTGVRGLALMPSVAAAESQKMQAISEAGAVIGQTIDKIDQERTTEELRQLNLSMLNSQSDFDSKYNKDVYSAGDIPEGVEVRLTNKNIVDGVEVSTPRDDIPAYEVKAQIYQQEMNKAIRAGSERITNKRERQKWVEEKEALVASKTASMLATSEKQQQEFNRKSLALDIETAVNQGQFDIALALSSDIKNANVKRDTKQQIKLAKEVNTYDTLALSSDNPEVWAETEEAISMLRDPEKESQLTTSQRIDTANKLERALNLGKQDFAIAQKEVVANNAADIKVDLDKGAINYTDAQFKQMRNDGLLSNSQYIGYTKQLNDNIKSIELQKKSQIEIQSGYINPKNKEHMKAVDAEFTSLAKASNPWQATQQVVQKYNVLPPAVNNAFEMANITGGNNLASAAAQFNVLNETNPVAMMNVKAPRVKQVAAYMGLGMDSSEALNALSANESLSPAQIETRKGMMSGRGNAEENTDALSSMFSDSYGGWFSTPDTPVFMAAEFTALTEANLAMVGFDIDVARRMAFDTIKGKYKPTEINGFKQVLPFMPQEPDELVKKQIKNQLGDDVIIQSDQLTENQVLLGNDVTYMAYKDLGDGNIELLDRFKYNPDSIKKQQAKEQQATQDKKIAEAIAEREEIEAKKAREKARKEKEESLRRSYKEKTTAQKEAGVVASFKKELNL